jgi:hypothetical protein
MGLLRTHPLRQLFAVGPVAAAPAHYSPGFARLCGLRRAGAGHDGRNRAVGACVNLTLPEMAFGCRWPLRGSVGFCPDWYTIYGVVAGLPSWVSLYVSPETTRCRPLGARLATDQIDHVIAADLRSARDALQNAGKQNCQFKMAEWTFQ